MKFIFCLLIFAWSATGFAQNNSITYKSHFYAENIFPTGAKIVFKQFCADWADTLIKSGTVVFLNKHIGSIKGIHSIIITNEMISRQTFEGAAKDLSNFLSLLKAGDLTGILINKTRYYAWNSIFYEKKVTHAVVVSSGKFFYQGFVE